MEWYRAYHGTCSDPKWPIVARKAKVSVGVVVSVWFALLESASQASERGSVANFDPETVDALYGYDDGTTEAVFGAMLEKGLICEGRICAWDKRQPKREREDNSAARVRQHREKERQETQPEAAQAQDAASVTPCNASVTPPEQSREEQTREDIKYTSPIGEVVGAKPPTSAPGVAPPREPEPGEPGRDSPASSCPCEKIRDMYHAAFPEHPRVALLNAKRRGAIKARWSDAGKRLRELKRPDSAAERLAYFQRLFKRAAMSDFLTGKKAFRDGSVYRVDFDKLMSPGGFMGVIEGKYDNRQEAW